MAEVEMCFAWEFEDFKGTECLQAHVDSEKNKEKKAVNKKCQGDNAEGVIIHGDRDNPERRKKMPRYKSSVDPDVVKH